MFCRTCESPGALYNTENVLWLHTCVIMASGAPSLFADTRQMARRQNVHAVDVTMLRYSEIKKTKFKVHHNSLS